MYVESREKSFESFVIRYSPRLPQGHADHGGLERRSPGGGWVVGVVNQPTAGSVRSGEGGKIPPGFVLFFR